MIKRVIRKNLLDIANAYRKATGQTLSAVSREFYGNSNFLSEFRAGRQSLSVDKLNDVVEQFRAQWPDNADWPWTMAVMMTRRPRE